MNQSNINRLLKNFPEIYDKYFYTGIGDGWFPLLERLSYEIMDLCRERGVVPPRALQVKEKFGALRAYFEYIEIDDMEEIVSKYERESVSICELCGEKGFCKPKNGWVKTLCESCRNTP